MSKFLKKLSKGYLSKAVYLEEGGMILVKGNSDKCREPWSEVIASRYYKKLNNPTVEYTIGKIEDYPEVVNFNNFKHVSKCAILDIPLYQFYDTCVGMGIKGDDYLKNYNKLELSSTHLIKMMLADAVIGNKDRHVNNFDITIKDKILVNAPMLDFGASLLYDVNERDLKVISGEKIGSDSCKPLKNTHKEQIRLLMKRYKRRLYFCCSETVIDELLLECEDIFALMTPKRAEAIKAYIRRRHEVYVKPYSIDIPCKEVVIKDKEKEYELLANLLYNQKAVNKGLYLEFTSKGSKESILYHLEELRRSVLVKGVG